MSINLRGNPFYLNEQSVRWVEETFSSLSLDEKIGQLFCPAFSNTDKETVTHFTDELHVGGMMVRALPAAQIQDTLRIYQENSKIPMLISANLESGGDGAVLEGTSFAMPEGCSATGNIENGYRLGKVSCREAAAAGVNWGYAPIVDIDRNYRNPITNIRSFGNDPGMVLEMARGYLRAANEEGIAPTIKHFPGDGDDERDQHLLVSVNSLGYEEWLASYGEIYRTLIAEGVPCVMAGHIAQPAAARHVKPDISDREAFYPGSLSKPLLTGVLRGELQFNGLIVTDSTLMVGFLQMMPRKKAVPYCIECGCDMMLFNRSLDEDVRYMKEGYRDGILSEERLNDAVMRILALKAYLKLPEKKREGTLVPDLDLGVIVNSEESRQWVKECADYAVTLVKDNRHILPMSPKKAKRVYLNVIENQVANNTPFALDIKNRLVKEGFDVTLRERAFDFDPNIILTGEVTPEAEKVMAEIFANTEDFVSQYDLCMIVLNMETVSNATVVRVAWKVVYGMGNDIPWYSGEMPLVAVSTANPYHLLDIPMADVYVNAYTGNQATLDAVFEKLMGRSDFKGVSPVDAFCGHEDCRVL
ncbi:MAG: glycoside hydrolase family 3 protein [Lachnospiraceae bacterium]|nr:glycoside hydrolase family 3 protein [Lachnospiraceae bacterium]